MSELRSDVASPRVREFFLLTRVEYTPAIQGHQISCVTCYFSHAIIARCSLNTPNSYVQVKNFCSFLHIFDKIVALGFFRCLC